MVDECSRNIMLIGAFQGFVIPHFVPGINWIVDNDVWINDEVLGHHMPFTMAAADDNDNDALIYTLMWTFTTENIEHQNKSKFPF